MNKIIAFFKLIRWPNLLMIILAQVLLQYMVIQHVFSLIHIDSPLNHFYFILLMMSTVFMAAYGYVYNDIQDIYIDEINKNDKRIIDVYINKKTGIIIAYVLLLFALISALYLAISLQMIQLFFIHMIIAIGLWFYSKQLKKRILAGNIMISFFTAFSVYIVWLYHLVVLSHEPGLMVEARKIIPFLNVVVIAYAAFAFLISIIREIFKDVEDIKGDEEKGLRTLPIVFGVKRTKWLVYFLSMMMLLFTIYSSYYTFVHNWMKLSVYLIIAVGFPLLYLMINLQKSKNNTDFTDLSTLAKIIMVAGILSMQIFYISY